MTSANDHYSLTQARAQRSYANVAAGRAEVHPFNTLGAAISGAPTGSTSSIHSQQQPYDGQTSEQPTQASGQVTHSSQHTRQRSRSSPRSMDVDGGSRKRPGSSWSNDFGGREDGRMGCLQHDEHPPFFTPSYLRHSRHVQRLQREWEEHVSELVGEAQRNPPQPPKQPSLSTSSSNVNLNKMHSQHIHRAPVQDVIERLPPLSEEDRTHSLPSRWSDEDHMAGLEIMADGSEVRFNGVTKTTDEAASVRSDHPMPKEVGLYYFEVTVLSRGKDGLIGIGFSSRKVNLNRLPGWEADSWAYHGDDGYAFACSASGKAYGPRYSSQDVIGCGVNFRTGNAFFTKNGQYLGVAFPNVKADNIYPSVGIKKPGEHLRVNFGRHPFVFDIDRMMLEEQQLIKGEIAKADLSGLHPPDDENALIHNLIGQYLAHEGYIETSTAFYKDVYERQESLTSSFSLKPTDAKDDIDSFNRQKIRRSILDGDIDLALKYMNAFYPHVLEDERNKDINFHLRCRKFIEMMRRCHELSAATSSPTTVTKSVASLDSNGHADDADDGTADTQMELDDQLHREASRGLEPPLDGASSGGDDVDMDASQELPPKASFMKHQDLLNEVYRYGAELRTAFIGDARPQIQKMLVDIFALMAYRDPTESVVGALLDPHGRVEVAEEVNGAILVSLGKPPSAALEKLCAQTEALLDETALRTGGGAAFVNVREDFLRP